MNASCHFRWVCLVLAILPLRGRAADANDATAHFQSYLAGCGTNEIRCLWFLNNEPKVGMVMTLNLQAETAFTVREVFNWACQSSQTHPLTHAQVISLRDLTGKLPGSDSKIEFRHAVSVAIWCKDKPEIFHYDRQHPPAEIQRLYDLGGGYFYQGIN